MLKSYVQHQSEGVRPERGHDDALLRGVPVLTLTDGLRAVRLKLYDAAQGRMVTVAVAVSEGRQTLPEPMRKF